MNSAFVSMVKRDLLVSMRRPVDALSPLIFFVMVITLFPFGVSPEAELLREIGPGLIWVSALLSVMLSLGQLFQADVEDGSLEQVLLASRSLGMLMLAKLLAFWLVAALPLIIVCPLLSILLSIEAEVVSALVVSLLLGTPVLCSIGAIGAALSAGLKNSGILMVLIVLPLYVPVLIFGTGSVMAVSQGQPAEGLLAIQGALFLLSISLSPLAMGASLKITVGE